MSQSEDELTAELGRVEVLIHHLEKRREEILQKLPDPEDTHCVLCGDELSGGLEWDTGVCQPCAEVPL